MLKDYFSLEISRDGLLHSLPLILMNHIPDLTFLPFFLYHLGSKVNWQEEKPCFHDICHELAQFYSLHPGSFDMIDPNELSTQSNITSSTLTTDLSHLIEHTLFPAFRSHFLPGTRHAADGTVIQIACLPDLYKVFERC
jgi:DNA mismatch repair protein MLH1